MNTSAMQLSIPAGVTTTLPSTLPASYSNTITVGLDRTNYLLWRTQIVPHIAGQGCYGFLDGSLVAPPQTITTGEGITSVTQPNPQ